MSNTDFRTYYHLESYLFDEVSTRFKNTGTLSAFDFFCIVIWKANRAKSRVAHRLLAQQPGVTDLDSAVSALLTAIGGASDRKERLRVLIEDWGFRLPMASAILTILYPGEFTVYDARVCEVFGNFKDVQYKTKFESLWQGYCTYVDRVKFETPSELSLRDKDRWLWGKSFAIQLKSDISEAFRRGEDDSESEA
jgi:hypothetical protein